ncbi:MAG: exodeoxyribonuclease V subunit gamma, partial [Gammaproteobacteria bacterium]|nr:exodeoxyribonuclease V subunit gamma [Gammaproteobacteria bacterium]
MPWTSRQYSTPSNAGRARAGASRIEIHAGNRLETLAARLADCIGRDPGDPLEPERIVVPHPTLGRWLTLELATHCGVAAHQRLELPAQFAWSIMREAVPAMPREQPFAPDRLRWRVFDALGRPGETGEAPLRRYLADGDPRKRFELADRLARVY